MAFFIVLVIINILFRVFIALAVNNDCKANAIKSKTLWTALGAVFPISAFIYLALRNTLEKETPKYCYSCGATSPPEAICCVNCGNATLQNYVVTNQEVYKKKAKSSLIAAIVVFIIYFIIAICASVFFAADIYKRFYERNNINEFHEQIPDFDDDFGEFDDFFDNFDYYGEQP